MTNILKNCKIIIYTLLFSVIALSCADPEPGVPDLSPVHIDPTGNYELFKILRTWRVITPSSNTYHYDEPTTDCDLFSTLEFKSDNTFKFIDYNYNNDNDCSDYEIITGNYVDTAITNPFSGELTFESTFRGNITYDGRYGSGSEGLNGLNMLIQFEIVLEDQTYTYNFYYRKI